MKRPLCSVLAAIAMVSSAAPNSVLAQQEAEAPAQEERDPLTRLELLARLLSRQSADIPEGYVLVGDIQVPIGEFLGFGRATFGPAVYWPFTPSAGKYVITVVFDTFNPGFPLPPNPGYVNEDRRNRFRQAMGEIERVCNIDFREQGVSPPGPHIFVRNSDGNNSPVGMQPILNTINIVSWNDNNTANPEAWKWIMVHELMHSLGFQHEQSRADRNQFVQINYGNVIDEEEPNFDIVGSSRTVGPYDFGSLMHYGQCAFTTCGTCGAACRSITVLPPNGAQWQEMIGQRNGLSTWDARMLSYLYEPVDWSFVDDNGLPPGDGTFRFPWPSAATGLTQARELGTLHIMPGNYSARGLYTRRMFVKAPVGGAVLGQ